MLGSLFNCALLVIANTGEEDQVAIRDDARKSGGAEEALSELGLDEYAFFSSLPCVCASAPLPSIAPPLTTAAAAAAFLRRFLLDLCSIRLPSLCLSLIDRSIKAYQH